MNTTHDDNATTWRDLADALTPPQIAYLENWENHPEIPPMADGSAPPAEQHALGLLFAAREYVGHNAAAALYADVAPPPDDGQHHHWQHDGDGKWSRFFTGSTREVGDTTVIISGFQDSSGTITRSITVDGDAEDLDAAQAREVAAALLDAAAELDRLSDKAAQ